MSEFDITRDGVCLVCGYSGGQDIIYHQPRSEHCYRFFAGRIIDAIDNSPELRETLKTLVHAPEL